MSHYMLGNDYKALTAMDLAFEKGPVDHDMYFYKGKILSAIGKDTESLPYFDKAIALIPDEPDFFDGKAEVYYKLNKIDSCLIYLTKAMRYPNCDGKAYLLKAEIYQAQKNYDTALMTYKSAQSLLTIPSRAYQNCSFNIGLVQQLMNNNDDAKTTFEEHLQHFENDFHAIAKLIQVYYALSLFEDALPLKQKLYKAHKSKALPPEMDKMFCIDQFILNEKRVMVFEHYEASNDALFPKLSFYLMKEDNQIECKVDLESGIAFQLQNSKAKYVLSYIRENIHSTYWSYVYPEKFKYREVKENVINILNGEKK